MVKIKKKKRKLIPGKLPVASALQVMPLKQAFSLMKKMCGGNANLARACRVTVGWVDRWGSSGRDGPVMRIPDQHWPSIIKASNGLVTEADLAHLHKRIVNEVE